ncbi:MAG: cation transporter, partial [Bacteroidota bacterium]
MVNIKRTSLPVTGMSCTNCAANIERNVGKVPGVESANIDFARERLQVDFDPSKTGEKEIIATVRRIGYGIATGKTELPIVGLHDNSDALSLEKLLSRQEGVLAVTVSYTTEHAVIEYIPGMIGIADLAQRIRKAGFDLVQPDETDEMEDAEAKVRAFELRKQLRLLITGLVFTVPLIFYSMARDFRLVYFPSDLYLMLIAATVVQFVVGWQF